MKTDDAIAVFSALAQETRLAIFRRLVAAGCAGLTAGEIAEAVGASPSRASFHLSTLAEANLVRATRKARQIVYRADFDAAARLVGFILKDCCRDEPALRRSILMEASSDDA